MSKRSLKAVLLCLALTSLDVIAQPATWDDAAFIDDEWSMAVTLENPKQRYFYFPPRTDFGVPAAGTPWLLCSLEGRVGLHKGLITGLST
nr:hypothetical protein [Oceanococcus sp. HetDA_MAG_MS8]